MAKGILASRYKHGEGTARDQSPEYRAWCAMKRRCTNPKATNYRFYGAKGTQVCQRWMDSFTDFLTDVGRKPTPEHTLDRYPDMKGNYEPGNVRWATKLEQSRNMRCCLLIVFNGISKTISEWAETVGIEHRVILHRLNRGWTIERALTYPSSHMRPNLHNPNWQVS